ncbi:hypothetical protein RMQ97_07750 [Maricaulis sp. D1M11]|uniref:hypothetical protein n=1 Tax=Maricaulis sp. D1M11 TaxID=3076117 RepID=UPI0039B587F7
MVFLLILAGSVAGIAAMVVANIYLKPFRPAEIVSLDDAAHRLDIDAVGFQPGEGILAVDGRSALVEERNGERLGLLVARGSDVVIRYLVPGMVRSARLDGQGGVRLSLKDFTFAPVDIPMGQTRLARQWADRLNDLQEG